jgi:hypothetical protein
MPYTNSLNFVKNHYFSKSTKQTNKQKACGTNKTDNYSDHISHNLNQNNVGHTPSTMLILKAAACGLRPLLYAQYAH